MHTFLVLSLVTHSSSARSVEAAPPWRNVVEKCEDSKELIRIR